ncbi:hypothetical protein JOF36_004027 [Pseudonocardia parietis]|uniref:Uncharacterized protein n=1 Tax=Pseudonocardia parietis TaxID=570936 RepID=A0ABS4VWN8_9PSEU|nr:hypothetical protein [Pseudonocardia parietis]MBP2368331.1 hypothetical protein [Pseudonocardia parietis]
MARVPPRRRPVEVQETGVGDTGQRPEHGAAHRFRPARAGAEGTAGQRDPAEQHRRGEHQPARHPLPHDRPGDQREREDLHVEHHVRDPGAGVEHRLGPEQEVRAEEHPGQQRPPGHRQRHPAEPPVLGQRPRAEDQQGEHAPPERRRRRVGPGEGDEDAGPGQDGGPGEQEPGGVRVGGGACVHNDHAPRRDREDPMNVSALYR